MQYHGQLPVQKAPAAAGTSGLIWGLPVTAWVKIGIVTVLMAATFRFNLVRLWFKTNPFNGEPNWRHAVCVPLIGLYYLYVHRDDLLAARVRHVWSGLLVLIGGVLIFGYGIWPGQNDFVKDIGMVIAVFGVVLLLAGWNVMKVAWFPIVFLLCALPWPDQLYSAVASPLQHLAARMAVGTLRLSGVEAYNSGTKISVTGVGGAVRTLNVAEACAGLRSLMTFISVGAAVAFLSVRPFWQKLIVVASAVPIAVFCNVLRVCGSGLLDQKSHELSEGFAHQFVGMIMLIPGFFMILLVGWLLDRIFVEEIERNPSRPSGEVKQRTMASAWPLPKTLKRPEPGAPKRARPPKPDGGIPPKGADFV